MDKRSKTQLKFLIYTFIAFLVTEFLVYNYLHWWSYGSIWAIGELPNFCAIQVYLGWLLWIKMEFYLLNLAGGKIIWESGRRKGVR